MPEIDGNFKITGLTARLIYAIEAALDVAGDDEEEPYPGIHDAYDKVHEVAEAARQAGFTYEPETSAQSQAFIDGAKPWPYTEDEEEHDYDGDDDTEGDVADDEDGCCTICGDDFAIGGIKGRSKLDPSVCEYCYNREG